MRKKLCTIAVMLVFILCFQMVLAVPIMAEDHILVMLNGDVLEFDVEPQLINDRTMVPMRKIFESLGASVIWDEDTQTITATQNGNLIVMQIDNQIMSVNGLEIILDVPPLVVQDRTLVPVRAVAEGLQAEVEWIGETQTVVITKESPAEMVATPTPSATATPSPAPVVGYEKNPAIPDYGAIMGEEYKAFTKPDEVFVNWCYEYQYKEKNLDQYIELLKENGFELTYETSKYGYGGHNLYFKKGDDGLFILYGAGVNRICIGFWKEGTAVSVQTEQADEHYRENAAVPNYGNFKSIDPLRADIIKDADGKALAARYTYPWEQRTAVPIEVFDFFGEDGWEIVGPIMSINAAVTKLTYMKDSTLVEVVIDQATNQISIAFSV